MKWLYIVWIILCISLHICVSTGMYATIFGFSFVHANVAYNSAIRFSLPSRLDNELNLIIWAEEMLV